MNRFGHTINTKDSSVHYNDVKVEAITVDGLTPGLPIKTSAGGELYSTYLSSSDINFSDGSAAVPSITGTDTDTGFYFGSNIIGFSAGGSEIMTISETNITTVAPLQFTSGTIDADITNMTDFDGGLEASKKFKTEIDFNGGNRRFFMGHVSTEASPDDYQALAFARNGASGDDPDLFFVVETSGNIYTRKINCQTLENTDGSVSLPSYSFKNYTNTGMYHDTSNIAFSMAGEDKFKVLSTGVCSFLNGDATSSFTSDVTYLFGSLDSLQKNIRLNGATNWHLGLLSKTASPTVFDDFAISVGDNVALVIDASANTYVKSLDITNQVFLDDGTTSLPTLSFRNNTVGIHSVAPNYLTFVTNSEKRINIVADGMLEHTGVGYGISGDSSLTNQTNYTATYVKKYHRYNGQNSSSWFVCVGTDNATDSDGNYDTYILGKNNGGNDPDIFMAIDGNGKTWLDSLDVKNSLVIPTYTPTSASDTNGDVGEIVYDSDYIYVKTGPAAWKRAALSTW